MEEPKDVQLLKNLAPFALPPFCFITMDKLSPAAEEVKHFLTHSLGELKQLSLNEYGDLLDGSEWMKAIANAFPRVKDIIDLHKFSFSKKQVETIINNSLHLQWLEIDQCKFRKLCCFTE
jgi:hypothetical protein